MSYIGAKICSSIFNNMGNDLTIFTMESADAAGMFRAGEEVMLLGPSGPRASNGMYVVRRDRDNGTVTVSGYVASATHGDILRSVGRQQVKPSTHNCFCPCCGHRLEGK